MKTNVKQAKAITKYVRSSAQKTRIPADIVRGMRANDALEILEHMPKKAAMHVFKTVKSALHNATHNHEMNTDNLVISEIRIDEGVRFKRYKEGSRGSYNPFVRPTCHISVILEETGGSVKEESKNKEEKKSENKKQKKETKVEEKPKTKASSAKKSTTKKKTAATKKKSTTKKSSEETTKK
jgi:large subunit ribosomal protein L22